MSNGEIVGPAELPCEAHCQVPEGVKLFPVPVPRHKWGDVVVCPNGCGRAWLIIYEDEG